MRYAVVVEKAKKNFSAYVPDVPGCVATGATVQETLILLRDAIRMHFDGMREDGERIPDPETLVDYLDVDLTPQTAAIGSRKQTGTNPKRPPRKRQQVSYG